MSNELIVGKMTREKKALAILMYRNRIRNDAQAYDYEIAQWGLGLYPAGEFPSAESYGQSAVTDEELESYFGQEDIKNEQ